MRKIGLLLTLMAIAIVVLVISCKKEENLNAMDFKITGVHDLTLELGDINTTELKAFWLGGDKEELAFQTSGLPNGVVATYDPPRGVPDFVFNQKITVEASADTGMFTVTVTAVSKANKTFSKNFQLHIKPVGNSKPIISLNSGNAINQRLNDPFFDPGYTALDDENGDITAQVQVFGTVNKDSSSVYTLSYVVTDSEGAKDSVTRTVTVLNDLYFLNGQYSCTTFLPNSTTYNWITDITASTTVNKRFKIFKISDCFYADVIMDYSATIDSFYTAFSQTYWCKSATDSIPHTYDGAGKIFNNGVSVSLNFRYNDTYFDSTLNTNVTQVKRDFYIK
ncbi:hypothetical protein BH11BAC2_BH11BAC2_20290 [soil metagenome]